MLTHYKCGGDVAAKITDDGVLGFCCSKCDATWIGSINNNRNRNIAINTAETVPTRTQSRNTEGIYFDAITEAAQNTKLLKGMFPKVFKP
jgi:hypothetical protein